MIKANAAGKIIFSGEHAVVYGNPAIATAINLLATTTIKKTNNKKNFLRLVNLNYFTYFTIDEVREIKCDVDVRYFQFLKGDVNIKHVLQHPRELLLYIFGCFIERLNIDFIDESVEIEVLSQIPGGYGMGSSGAIIVSFIKAFNEFFKTNFSQIEFLDFGREVENLQHGKSSGLDIYLALNGGCVYFESNNFQNRGMPIAPIVFVNTGKSCSSTGLCVSAVAKYFTSKLLLDRFRKVTETLDVAFQQNNIAMIKQCISENHRLLQEIGIVPARVSNFIAELEDRKLAAKISGAGAVCGDNAGIVLVVGEKDEIADVVAKYGYEIKTLL